MISAHYRRRVEHKKRSFSSLPDSAPFTSGERIHLLRRHSLFVSYGGAAGYGCVRKPGRSILSGLPSFVVASSASRVQHHQHHQNDVPRKQGGNELFTSRGDMLKVTETKTTQKTTGIPSLEKESEQTAVKQKSLLKCCGCPFRRKESSAGLCSFGFQAQTTAREINKPTTRSVKGKEGTPCCWILRVFRGVFGGHWFAFVCSSSLP